MPEEPENWKDVMEDLNEKIMPGITHWQSPHFHAYYPSQLSYPSIVGDMIANGLGTVNFSWVRKLFSKNKENNQASVKHFCLQFFNLDLQSSSY